MKRLRILYSNNIVVGCVIVVLISVPMAWGTFYPLTHMLDYWWREIAKYLITALIAISLMMIIFKKAIFPLGAKGTFKQFCTYSLFGILGAVVEVLFNYQYIESYKPISTIAVYILYCMAVALAETILYRGVILNAMLRTWHNTNNAKSRAVVTSSVIYALVHLFGLVTQPDKIPEVLVVVGIAFLTELYTCAVYIRTKNIWICWILAFILQFASNIMMITCNKLPLPEMTPTRGLGLVFLHMSYGFFAFLLVKEKSWKPMTSLVSHDKNINL